MLTKILKAVDIIGIPAILTFSGKEKSSSQFGGVCSLLFSLFAIWAVYNGARELFSLDNPQTVVSEVYSQDPREYIVSPSTFPLGFYVQGSAAIDYRYIIDPTIYTALVQLETFHMNGDYSLETLPTERCTQKHFGDMFSSFASAMELETSYCFAQDRISILGAYSSPIYQRILISVYQCNSTAVNNNCAPNDYVNAALDGGWVNILYGNMVIIPGNYDEPDQRYRDLFGTELSVTNSKGATIELRHLNVMTDSGWLVESWSREEFAKVNSISETSETRQLNDISTPLMSTGFEIGKLETNYSRSYKKIQEVLAEVAGLINTGLFCLLIATAGFFKLKVRETMMNELFDIDLDYKPPEKKDKNKANKNKKKNKKQQPQQTTPTEQMEDAKNDHSALRKLETDLSDHNRSKTPVIIRVEDSDKREDTPKAPRKNTRKLSANTAHKKGMEERKLIPPSRVMSHSYKDLAVMKSNLGVTQEESSSSFPTEELRRTKTPLRETHLFSEKEDPVKIELKILEEPEIDNYNPENSILMLDTLGNDTARGKEISTQEQRNNCELRINVERIEEGKLQEDIKGPEDGDGNNQSEESVHMLRKPKKIGISYWEYLLSFIYKPKRLRKKFRILDEGARNINMGLDVIHILKKMTELDKIKAILFNKDQLILFNNLPKPEIRPEDDALPGSQASLTRKLIRKANLAGEFGTQQEAINSYEFLKHKENKTEIDKKLIDIFYENLYGVQTEHS